MNKYTIEFFEVKTSAKGNTYAKTSLKDEEAKVWEVTIFSSFPDFANLKVGSQVEGTLKSQDYQGKVSYTLEAPKVAPTRSFTPKTGAIKEAQERKETSIKRAQDNRELGIKIASTMSMAVNIVLAQVAKDPLIVGDSGTIKKAIREWREWLWINWEAQDSDYPPFPSNES